MSRFFIGQRVKLVRLVTYPEFNGVETRISDRYEGEWGYGWWVMDGQYWCEEMYLEPIQPSGAAPSEHTFHQLMDLLTAGEVAPV